MGLEPTPTAWQAVVLPLYYGRLALETLACPPHNDKKECSPPASIARGPPMQTRPHSNRLIRRVSSDS